MTRREAIELFEAYPVREGFWDSEMSLSIARQFMQYEEEGIPFGAFVPENKRLRILRQELVLSQRMLSFVCVRGGEVLPTIVVRW